MPFPKAKGLLAALAALLAGAPAATGTASLASAALAGACSQALHALSHLSLEHGLKAATTSCKRKLY